MHLNNKVSPLNIGLLRPDHSEYDLNYFFLVVVTAVEKMLDRFDRRISDRFKLIEFREIDNEREIVQLSNYVLEVTLPVVLCKFRQ